MTMIVADINRASIEQVREYEIEEARNLQRALVPGEPLRAHAVEVTHKLRPVVEVGGDFLDYFVLADRTLGLYVGDVVGKGLPAALYAALTVGTLRGIHKTGQPPAEVLGLLNKRLRTRAMPKRYCAVQYAVFDPAARALRYVNAGLPGPLHISARGCRELRAGGLPSGLFDGASYDPQTVQLGPGDAVLFITDGLTDARNARGEEFGMDRLIEVCARDRSGSADALLRRIFAAVDEFVDGHTQHDDMTAAVLKLAM